MDAAAKRKAMVFSGKLSGTVKFIPIYNIYRFFGIRVPGIFLILICRNFEVFRQFFHGFEKRLSVFTRHSNIHSVAPWKKTAAFHSSPESISISTPANMIILKKPAYRFQHFCLCRPAALHQSRHIKSVLHLIFKEITIKNQFNLPPAY